MRGRAGGSRAAPVRPQAELITGRPGTLSPEQGRPAHMSTPAACVFIGRRPLRSPARRWRCRDRPRCRIVSSWVWARPAERALSCDQAACSPWGCAGLGPSGQRSLAHIRTAVRLAYFLREGACSPLFPGGLRPHGRQGQALRAQRAGRVVARPFRGRSPARTRSGALRPVTARPPLIAAWLVGFRRAFTR